MIKFFRHIRKSLLMENNTGKYFKYAIGEIVLVVIGILIALQINNWNEYRKQQDTLNNIYVTIKTDLQEDIKKIDKIISASEPLEAQYLAIINKTRKREDFNNCENCWKVNLGYSDIKLRYNGINLLLDYNKLNSNTNDSLSIKISRLYNGLANDIQIDNTELSKDTEAYLNIIASTKSWFPNLVKDEFTDEFIEYALTDVAYRNYATMIHYVYFVKYMPDLKGFKSQGIEFIEQINKRLNND